VGGAFIDVQAQPIFSQPGLAQYLFEFTHVGDGFPIDIRLIGFSGTNAQKDPLRHLGKKVDGNPPAGPCGPCFTRSMPCSNLVSRLPHDSFKHNFLDKCPVCNF